MGTAADPARARRLGAAHAGAQRGRPGRVPGRHDARGHHGEAGMSARDFDFLHGSWLISHRRLRERLTGCDEWDSFESTTRCRPILGGAGNMDEGELRGYHAITLRLHDPESGNWSLYWITDLTGAAIEPPVTGRFEGATGDFLGPDTHNGIPVVEIGR